MKHLILLSFFYLIMLPVFGQTPQCQTGILGLTSCCQSCNATLTMNPTGGYPPYTYLWMPGNQTTQTVTGLCAGNYSCIVTDANGMTCTGTGTVAHMFLTVNPTDASCSTCPDGNAAGSMYGGSGPYTYSWIGTSCGTGSVCSGIAPGTYTVCVTDSFNCTACVTYTIGFSVSVTEHNMVTSLTLFPNPTNGLFTVSSESRIYSYSIYSPTGTLLKRYDRNLSLSGNDLDITFLQAGLYFVLMETERGPVIRSICKH